MSPRGWRRILVTGCSPWRLACGLALTWAACVAAAAAAVPAPVRPGLADFQHTAWTTRDGAPADIWVLAQAADGHLWLGTGSGVYTFDGIGYSRVPAPKGSRWLSGNVTALLVRAPDDVWVGYFGGGASRLHAGRLDHYPPGSGLPTGAVYRLIQDDAGEVWAATSGGLARWRDGLWMQADRALGVPPGPAFWVHADTHGDLWLAAGTHLLRRRRGQEGFDPLPFAIGVEAVMAESADGTLWLSDAAHGTRRLIAEGGTVRIEPVPGLADVPAKRMAFAADGSLWLTDARNGGVLRLEFPAQAGAAAQAFRRRDGLSSDMAVPVLQDVEGNIWIGTNLGLNRFRRRDAMMLASTLDMAHRGLGIAGTAQGIAIATGGRLLREDDGHWVAADGFPEVLSMVAAGDGGLWLMGRALWHWREGALQEVPLPSPASVTTYDVQAIATAPDGALWMSLLGAGLYRRDEPTGWQLQMPASVSQPRAMAFDAAGRLWTGDAAGRVFWHHAGQRGRLPTTGLDVGAITALLPGRRHFLVAGERGLARFDGRRFHTLDETRVAELVAVTGMAEAGDGRLWLNGGRGVVLFEPAQAAAAFMPGARPAYRLFDERDGLLGVAVQSNATPTLVQGGDGRLWFSTNQGVAWIDPTRIGRNPRPPQVLLRSVSAGDVDYPPGPPLELPAHTRNLQVDYTATSLGMPERVAFRYRLKGVDDTWQEAGTRRQAFYTNLAPGRYHFEVLAANEDGVWSPEPVTQVLRIRPAFYQTWWFMLLCLLLVAGGLWLAYLMRLRQLGQHIRGRLQERHAERERIARELHDTLLQSIQGLILRFQAVSVTLPPLDPARSAMEQALQRADEVLVEGRDRVLDLRATAPDAGDLEDLLAAFGEELAQATDVRFDVSVQGTAEALDPIVRDELYRIGREAMLNACRHAEAGRIRVEVDYGPGELRLRVFDDGRGIDPDMLQRGGRPGHWGLHGMRERASRIGARLRIWSRPGAGTEVELRMPAGSAYRPCLQASRQAWLRAIFGGKPA
ncbi:sensor histidine kinase [Pseudoxanthomonas suwonensis]|uniref:Histidine kinase domain-containing protein n=1 Tax=Pseudoxanthomonas suwonensis TaxID=314722 RepID=A0A0E3UM79_9GAMM|nr:sensor histidine kinase [Pseudoxanthomonas suwonensis]AKC85805.1 hypothetical protein WQ53_02540 [Pseudoxanthomonas suwonensis]